jgi:Secretion system C-terminal sorting domain
VIRAALKLDPGTPVNDLVNPGTGYMVEVAVDLTKIGYPHGLGDGNLWIGATQLDYDAYSDAAENSSSREWWYRERSNTIGPAWAFMDPNTLVTGVVPNPGAGLPMKFALIGNYPNPFNPSTTIRFTLPEAANVTLNVFNVLGQRVGNIDLGTQSPGVRQVAFNASRLASGVYFYQLHMQSSSGKNELTSAGKMLLLK